ncbi:MAG: nicotinate-nucleotide adenylyltransferase [Desulfobacterota bacterium]|jgi:nicotinate-nucleotide adenylyltransferase|nr:nicotinate-nucleotide adenylyltransferase [Thermodesulfobacteriota bacterium]
MRLGIFGGTFNPIHVGHLRAAEEVREALDLERIVFVPSSMPPHKELDDNVEGAKRLEIVKLSIQGNPFFEVSSFEVDRPGNSYSIRTIEHFRGISGGSPYFIVGQDAFSEISSWYEATRLFDVAHFVVMSRPHAPRRPLEEILGEGAGRFHRTERGHENDRGNEIVLVDVTAYAVSSSMIRDLCRRGLSIRYLVSEKAHDFIRKERIYR